MRLPMRPPPPLLSNILFWLQPESLLSRPAKGRDFFCNPCAYFCAMTDVVSIGKMVATFGLKGELVLSHALGRKTDLEGVAALLIEERGGSRLPYFIVAAKGKNNQEILVQLEGIETKEKATTLLQKQVWIKQADFERHASKQAPISLLGYTLVEDGKPLGEIAEIIEQPHQMLCTIFINNKEVLIPLHEESLLKIDQRKKQIHVSLPEGLLDIYLA
jgi:16S rRNA processing protein RimM